MNCLFRRTERMTERERREVMRREWYFSQTHPFLYSSLESEPKDSSLREWLCGLLYYWARRLNHGEYLE